AFETLILILEAPPPVDGAGEPSGEHVEDRSDAREQEDGRDRQRDEVRDGGDGSALVHALPFMSPAPLCEPAGWRSIHAAPPGALYFASGVTSAAGGSAGAPGTE